MCHCRNTQCTDNHKGGGIVIYIRNSLVSEMLSISMDSESLWVKIILNVNTTPTTLLLNASYHPPNADPRKLSNFLTKSLDQMEINYPNSIQIIGGDFNKFNLDSLEETNYLTKLLSPPTRGSATLDAFLTNRPDIVKDVTCFTPSVESDHRAILLTPLLKIPPRRWKANVRDFAWKNRRRFNAMMENANLDRVMTFSNLDESVDYLNNSITACIDSAFPVKRVTMSDRDPIWVTPRVKLLLEKKARRNQNKNTKTLLEIKIQKYKLNYYNKMDSNDLWRFVDAVSHRKNEKRSEFLKHICDPNDLNNELAQRSTIANSVKSHPLPTFDLRNDMAPQITLHEVCNILQKTKRTSPGPDGIFHFIFSEYWDLLAAPLQYIWNLSLKTATFPTSYKSANVIAIPKVGSPKSSDDYRGVSITPIAARLFEKVVHNKWIVPRINEIGDPFQFAYRQHLSTEDCLLSFQHFILKTLDDRRHDGVHVILVDFSKAFDKMNQEIAADTFRPFIKSEHLRKWLYDFTKNRKQRLVWKDKPLPFRTIDRGCSQGTVGGPNVFSMFTNDNFTQEETTNVFKYSDDISLCIPCMKTPSRPQKQNLIKELENLKKWSLKKELSINVQKTKHLRFCLNRMPQCTCTVEDNVPDTEQSAKILGIYFQTDMSFSSHVTQLLRNLRRMCYIMKDMKLASATDDEIDQIFESLIISRIRYGLSIYGSDSQSLKKVDHFLGRCYEKKYCKYKRDIYFLLRNEDNRHRTAILANRRHPLHQYMTNFTKDRITRHQFQHFRPQTKTKKFHSSFCNRAMCN